MPNEDPRIIHDLKLAANESQTPRDSMEDHEVPPDSGGRRRRPRGPPKKYLNPQPFSKFLPFFLLSPSSLLITTTQKPTSSQLDRGRPSSLGVRPQRPSPTIVSSSPSMRLTAQTYSMAPSVGPQYQFAQLVHNPYALPTRSRSATPPVWRISVSSPREISASCARTSRALHTS